MDNCKINNKDELERWGKKKESFIQALRQTNDLEEKNKLKQKIEMCKKAIKDLHETDIIDDNTYESHLEEFSLQKPFEDWGDAPTGEKIIGRETELLQLVELTHSQKNKSRLTIIHGFPGIGKTSLTVELVKKLKPDFDLSIWRSLREKPKIDEVLNRILENISNHNISVMPESLDDMLSLLMSYLKKKRCLIVLDNFESILKFDDEAGKYIDEHIGYGYLLKRISTTNHNSCFIITSREIPKDFVAIGNDSALTNDYPLGGLDVKDFKILLANKNLKGTETDWDTLINKYYGGNPLALKIVSEHIKELFNRDIKSFLTHGNFLIGNIKGLIDEQFERLTSLEKDILYWLSLEREPVSILTLFDNIYSVYQETELYDAIYSLKRRHLILGNVSGFFLQNYILEYITNRLIKTFVSEIDENIFTNLFNKLSVNKAQNKNYIKKSQISNFLAPIIDGLKARYGKKELIDKLSKNLNKLQEEKPNFPGYASSNTIQLLKYLNFDFTGYNFNRLCIWQTDFHDIELQSVNFDHCNFKDNVFADTFGSIPTVSFNNEGNYLAAGTFNGQLRIWNIRNYTPIVNIMAHDDWITSLCFSPDDRLLATASSDQNIKIWNCTNCYSAQIN